jgi:ubiquinone/menaquinone biosynthesis C-methylase UbiE
VTAKQVFSLRSTWQLTRDQIGVYSQWFSDAASLRSITFRGCFCTGRIWLMRPIACRPRGFSAYKYLLNGIREFPTAEALAAEIADHGFQEVSYESYHGRCRYTHCQ